MEPFQPVSAIDYLVLVPDGQVLVCSLDTVPTTASLVDKWQGRAAAIFSFAEGDDVIDVIRDILANPQIRALVLDGDGAGASKIREFWSNASVSSKQGIPQESLDLVRRFVDLYDDDCGFKGPRQPFWPKRMKYTHPKEV